MSLDNLDIHDRNEVYRSLDTALESQVENLQTLHQIVHALEAVAQGRQ